MHNNQIVDQVAKADHLGRIHHALGNEEKSVEAYEELLQLNSANLDTYRKIIKSRGVELPADPASNPLSEAYQSVLKGILDDYRKGFPKTNAHLRLGLRYLTGDSFSEYLETYMRPLMIKGVPSLMMDMREFYNQPDKVQRIDAFLTSCITSMENEMTLRGGDEDE